MTKTYTQHNLPTPDLGSAPRAGTAAPGISGLTRVPVATLRRAVLAGGAAALAMAVVAGTTAAAGSAPLASPDAELIALCAVLDALHRRLDALFPSDWCGTTDAELEAADAAARLIEAEQRLVLDEVCALAPATTGGCAAVARSVALLRPDLLRAGPSEDLDVRLLAVLVRGLAGGA